jgi:hypothetical protein
MVTNNNLKYYKIEPKNKNNKTKIRTNTQYINETTGEVIKEESYDKWLKLSKKGWCRMYKDDFVDAMIEIANKPNAIKIYLWFLRNKIFKKDGSMKVFKQKDIANELGIKPQNVSRAIKDLQQASFIAKIDNEWRYNPFIIGVTGMSDEEYIEAQHIWEKKMGYYISK